MPSPGRLASVLLQRRIPLRTRVGLLHAELGRRIRAKSSYPVAAGQGEIFLSHADYDVDWKSFAWVFADDAYPADCDGAVVLDIGAHKGYYGAYALAHGARAVVSFEPETANLELLERAAATYRARGADWRVQASAVGAERGEAALRLMAGSWAHSLHPPDSWAQWEVGTQRVHVEAMADVLEDVRPLGGPLVVKINTEGEECRIVLGTPPAAWTGVSELFVEMHEWAGCSDAELESHLAPVGFRRVSAPLERVLWLRREEAPRSGSRTAPR